MKIKSQNKALEEWYKQIDEEMKQMEEELKKWRLKYGGRLL
jgi:hypothetical protein